MLATIANLSGLLAVPAASWFLPGYLLCAWAFPRTQGLERAALSLLLGIVTTGPVLFCGSFFLRQPVTALSVSGVGLLCAGVALALRKWMPSEPTPESAPEAPWLLGATLGVAALFALREVPFGTWSATSFSTCPLMSSLYLLEDGSGGGLQTWDPWWGHSVTHLFQRDGHGPTWGLTSVLADQRMGSAATLVQALAWHGIGGLIVALFAYYFLVLAFGVLLLRRHLRSVTATLAIACALLLGVRTLADYAVNENVLALGLGMGLLHLLLDAPSGRQRLLAALVFSWCVWVRPAALVWLPACVLLIPGARAALGFAAAAFLASVPLMIANAQIFGAALTHPSARHFTVSYELLGFSFRFHPLNYPVAEALLRPEGAAFPMMLRVPLEGLLAFGTLLVALAGVGLASSRRHLGVAGAWALPVLLPLMLIVGLDPAKASYVLLALAPLPWVIGAGVAFLQDRLGASRRTWLLAAGLLMTLQFAPRLLRGLELPVDPRPQHRVGFTGLGDGHDEEAQRDALTRPGLTPKLRLRDFPGLLGLASYPVSWGWLSLDSLPVLPGLERHEDMPLWPGWRLLARSGPPRQHPSRVHEGPVLVTLGHERSAEHHFSMMPMDRSSVAPYLGYFPEHGEFAWKYLALPLRVPTRSSAAQVEVSYALERLRIDIEVEDTGEVGYVNLGLSEAPLEALRSVEVRIGGVAQPLHVLVLEGAPAPGYDDDSVDPRWRQKLKRRARIISNEPWHFERDRRIWRPRRGAWPTQSCGQKEVAGVTLGVGPNGAREDVDAWRFRLREVSSLSAEPPDCHALRFAGER